MKSNFACAGLLCSNLNAFVENKCSCNFLLHGSAFAVDFAILRSDFLCHVQVHFGIFFASGLKRRNVLVSIETLWLIATGKATRRPF